MRSIPLYQPYLHGNARAYVNECIDTGWISSRGTFVSRFERDFADFVQAEDAVSVSNGTVALHLVLTALGLKAGDEVIVPALTYIASVNTILQTGATPVYVDSLEATLQVDPAAIRKAITPLTRAIMVVHLYGHPCDMDAIMEIADQHGLLVIEDCAEGFGAYWKGRHVGTFGDVATFSFYGNKTITTGEGGMVLARNAEVLARCRHLKGQAVSNTREYWHDALGFNYRMTNIQAAIGVAQLEQAPAILEMKRAIARHYRENLTGLPLRTHEPVGDVVHSFWMCSVIFDSPSARPTARKALKEDGIETRPFFYPAYQMPHARADAVTPVCDNLSLRGMNVPSYPGLGSDDVERICGVIRRTLESDPRGALPGSRQYSRVGV